MKLEEIYSAQAGKKHLKAFGQFFTPGLIAEFMCRWAGKNAKNMLDPAVGNGMFLHKIAKLYPHCNLTGYELDAGILDFFGNTSGAKIFQGDYLTMDWQAKYDAIVGNPPYNRFQSVGNRQDILQRIFQETGCRYSSNSNLYLLFLAKSIFQLADKGRLAYLIPSEFLNSAYGAQLKEKLLQERLLRCVINFADNEKIFPAANTTCCILLLDRIPKKDILFFNLASVEELLHIDVDSEQGANCVKIEYGKINAAEKWRPYLYQEEKSHYHNLVPIEKYCRIERGIATGANDFFCLSSQQAATLHIDKEYLKPCLCHSRDVREIIFGQRDWQALADKQCQAYLLDIQGEPAGGVKAYIQQGEKLGLPQRYLLSKRHPWYSMEQKSPAPILISSAYRNNYKVLRNLAKIANLTAFHRIFVREAYENFTDIIFCYLLTETARELIDLNRKEMGRGLAKLQPGDLLQAEMLDIEILHAGDIKNILDIYSKILAKKAALPSLVQEIEKIFQPYYYKNSNCCTNR